jgi:hypothetical protein
MLVTQDPSRTSMAISYLQVWRLRPWPNGAQPDDVRRVIGASHALKSSGGAGCMRERATVQFQMLSLRRYAKPQTLQVELRSGYEQVPSKGI